MGGPAVGSYFRLHRVLRLSKRTGPSSRIIISEEGNGTSTMASTTAPAAATPSRPRRCMPLLLFPTVMAVALLLASLVPAARGKPRRNYFIILLLLLPFAHTQPLFMSPFLLFSLPFLAAGAITYATNGEQTMKAHFSDFYEIMQPEDYT